MTQPLWRALDAQPTRNSHAQVVDAIGADIIRGQKKADGVRVLVVPG